MSIVPYEMPKYRPPDYTLTLMQLAPLVCEAAAYLECSDTEKAMQTLKRARAVIKSGTCFIASFDAVNSSDELAKWITEAMSGKMKKSRDKCFDDSGLYCGYQPKGGSAVQPPKPERNHKHGD